jgi:hypothetical protein
VEAIVAEDIDLQGEPIYFIKWAGYSDADNEWVSLQDLNAPDVLEKWNTSAERQEFIFGEEKKKVKLTWIIILVLLTVKPKLLILSLVLL